MMCDQEEKGVTPMFISPQTHTPPSHTHTCTSLTHTHTCTTLTHTHMHLPHTHTHTHTPCIPCIHVQPVSPYPPTPLSSHIPPLPPPHTSPLTPLSSHIPPPPSPSHIPPHTPLLTHPSPSLPLTYSSSHPSPHTSSPHTPTAGGKDNESAEDYFKHIMSKTDTLILWPSRLKIGAKSKKGSGALRWRGGRSWKGEGERGEKE